MIENFARGLVVCAARRVKHTDANDISRKDRLQLFQLYIRKGRRNGFANQLSGCVRPDMAVR